MASRRLLQLAAALIAIAVLGFALSGCSTVSYYVDSVVGHLRVLHAARPFDDWLSDPSTPEDLRKRLIEVQGMRRFAVEALDLPDNASYKSYADLHRAFVVWNVFATPPLSLELREWCFPVAGCVEYRGYFDHEDAERYGQALREEGLDVQVAGIPAYSTLGFTPDPVLSTFVRFPEGEVARLIFHELAHQKVYLAGDTPFNESFATTVEGEGVKRWLKAQNDPQMSLAYEQFETRKKRFLQLLYDSRTELEALYASSLPDDVKKQRKEAVFKTLSERYQAAKQDPRDALFQYVGYDGYFARPINNANLAAIATYTRLVPAFVKLLAMNDNDLPRFYAAVKALSQEQPGERDRDIDQLLQEPHGNEP